MSWDGFLLYYIPQSLPFIHQFDDTTIILTIGFDIEIH